MTGTLLALLLLAIAVVGWSATRSIADAARRHGQAACARAKVQWLDQSVVLTRVGLRRDAGGRIRLLSQFSFDYSIDGIDRRRGAMALLGDQLQWITDPADQATLVGHG